MKTFFFILFLSPIILTAQTFTLADSTFKENQKFITHDIQFEYDKPVFRPESYIHLDSIFVFLLLNTNLQVEISNHCDERFSNHYSTCLTCKRAQATKEYLVKKGITSDRIKTKGLNDAEPLIKNAKTEEEHKINRRTEIKIISI